MTADLFLGNLDAQRLNVCRLCFAYFHLLLASGKSSWRYLIASTISRVNSLQLGCICSYAPCVIINVTALNLFSFRFITIHTITINVTMPCYKNVLS